MFNALRYREELEEAGFTRDQAEVSVKVLIDVMNENFATKADLKELELKLTLMGQTFGSAIKEMEYKLTIKLGTMLTIGIGLTATIVKLLETGH